MWIIKTSVSWHDTWLAIESHADRFELGCASCAVGVYCVFILMFQESWSLLGSCSMYLGSFLTCPGDARDAGHETSGGSTHDGWGRDNRWWWRNDGKPQNRGNTWCDGAATPSDTASNATTARGSNTPIGSIWSTVNLISGRDLGRLHTLFLNTPVVSYAFMLVA